GRMTGYGQTGPMSQRAGHDINYIALSGTLAAIGRQGQPPTPPLNLVGDFGGGGMLLAFGLLAALVERQTSGRGQVVDAAMVDGAALLAAPINGAHQTGFWTETGTNLLDSGAHFYDVYQTADGKYVSIGAIEPHFYAELLQRLGLEAEPLPGQMDRESWPEMKRRFAEIFVGRTRAEWCEVFGESDACFAPVLDFDEAAEHPHNRLRETFVRLGPVRHPAPAPRFDRTPPAIAGPPPTSGQHTDTALADWGIEASEVDELRKVGAVA
ncbi:MAG: CaiB/BaiF CoA-transferase family protein, partial [Proteobacteria bacterium]|nr:CaiB/BaiF CoA-transferase family protein [Pseudomonadota bacterium]